MDLSVAHPGLLAAGLACALLPVAIHLIRRRRPPMRWGAMRFVAEALRRQRRRLRIEQLLLLIARCVLLALLGVAIARPSLGGGALAGAGGRTLVIVLDDTITSTVRAPDGRREFDRSRDLAAAALDALDAGAGDRAAVVLLSGPAEDLVSPPSADLMGVKRALAELTPTDAAADWTGAIERARSAIDGTPRGRVLIASALRAGSLDTEGTAPGRDAPLAGATVLAPRPAESPAASVAVVAVSPRRPVLLVGPAAGAADRDAPIRVVLRRFGPAVGRAETTAVRVRSDAEPSVVGRAEVRFSAGQTEAETLVPVSWPAELTARALPLRVEIDPDLLPADDAAPAVVEVRRTLRVGVLARRSAADASGLASFGPADWLRAALAPSDIGAAGLSGGIEPGVLDPALVNDAALAALDAVIVADPAAVGADAWDRLGAFARAGGLTLVFPSGDDDATPAWAGAFERAFGGGVAIGRRAVDLPEPRPLMPGETAAAGLLDAIAPELGELARGVRVSRVIALDAADTADAPRVLLTLTDGTPWLVESSRATPDGPARVLIAASALDLAWTDLPARPLFVALVQEIVRRGVGLSAGPRTVVAGGALGLPADAVRLESLIASGDAPAPGDATARRAGAFAVLDRAGAAVGSLAVVPDARGSATEPGNAEAIGVWLGALAGSEAPVWLDSAVDRAAVSEALRGSGERTELWTILLIAAAALALTDLVLARRASHADAPTARASGADRSARRAAA